MLGFFYLGSMDIQTLEIDQINQARYEAFTGQKAERID